jgi:hypothetical protein
MTAALKPVGDLKGTALAGTPQSKHERMTNAQSGRFALQPAPSYLAVPVGPIALLVWRTSTSMEGVRAIEEVFSRLQKVLAPASFGFLTVALPDVDVRVESRVRTELARLLKAYGPSIGGAAIAYEGSGFKATIARSVVTAISLASQNEFPYRVFASVDPAMQWLATKLGRVTDEVSSGVQAVLRRSEP